MCCRAHWLGRHGLSGIPSPQSKEDADGVTPPAPASGPERIASCEEEPGGARNRREKDRSDQQTLDQGQGALALVLVGQRREQLPSSLLVDVTRKPTVSKS